MTIGAESDFQRLGAQFDGLRPRKDLLGIEGLDRHEDRQTLMCGIPLSLQRHSKPV